MIGKSIALSTVFLIVVLAACSSEPTITTPDKPAIAGCEKLADFYSDYLTSSMTESEIAIRVENAHESLRRSEIPLMSSRSHQMNRDIQGAFEDGRLSDRMVKSHTAFNRKRCATILENS